LNKKLFYDAVGKDFDFDNTFVRINLSNDVTALHFIARLDHPPVVHNSKGFESG